MELNLIKLGNYTKFCSLRAARLKAAYFINGIFTWIHSNLEFLSQWHEETCNMDHEIKSQRQHAVTQQANFASNADSRYVGTRRHWTLWLLLESGRWKYEWIFYFLFALNRPTIDDIAEVYLWPRANMDYRRFYVAAWMVLVFMNVRHIRGF